MRMIRYAGQTTRAPAVLYFEINNNVMHCLPSIRQLTFRETSLRSEASCDEDVTVGRRETVVRGKVQCVDLVTSL